MNTHTYQGPVAIKNVAAFMAMTVRLVDRAPHLPGFGVCSAPSGYGKTYASIFSQNKTRAIRTEVGDSWTRRTFLSAVLKEFGESPARKLSIADLAEKTIHYLSEDTRRPLIVDEADKLVDKGMIEIVREIQESSGAPVILIGEERLPAKLLTVERLHNRVLDWFQAQPCDLDDVKELAKAFARGIKLQDDLLDTIRTVSGGRARRIVVNISHAAESARNKSVTSFGLKEWGKESFFTGEPPAPRAVEMFSRKKAAA